MNRNIFLPTLMLAVCLGLSVPVLADPPEGKGKPDKSEKHAGKKNKAASGEDSGSGKTSVLVSAGITAAVAHGYALDAGVDMRSYKSLPPGIRKNLARGKPLPPGIAKKVAPPNVLARLPHYPGYDWQVAGSDLILVQVGTAIVADVLQDVFR